MGEKVRYISSLEHALIVSLAGLLVVFVYSQFIDDIISNYNWAVGEQQALLAKQATGKQTLRFGFGPPGYFVGLFHLGSFLLFLALALGKKFRTALLLTMAYFATLLYDHYSRFLDLESALKGWYGDAINLVVFILLFPLLIWELTIIFRVVRQTLKTSKLA